MVSLSRRIVAGIGAAAVVVCFSGRALAERACPEDPPVPVMKLPHLRAALAHGQEGIIVAMGSSSTAGTMASDPARTYPAELQSYLSALLPSRHIAVINRGIGGQDAGREFARLEADAIAVRPQLVVWQVGANAALRGLDPHEFRDLVTAGVREMHAADIDVILMDNQRSPKLLASHEDTAVNEALAEVAHETGAALFSRNQLMESWEQGGDAPVQFVAADGLHHNDLGYRCIARALGSEIAAGVTPAALSASR
jgi:acyl-CoA thioesterase I